MTLFRGSNPIRPILQAEATECGLASLAMIARAHGHKVDLPSLRKLHPVSMQGATLERLIAIASALELAPRPLRLELDELDQLVLPAILHWDLNHFVVIEKVRGDAITILDPAVGRRTMSRVKVSAHFTGVALELTPTSAFKPVIIQAKVRLRDLWSRLANLDRALSQVILLSLVLQLTTLLAPLYIQTVIDGAVTPGDRNLLTLLLMGFTLVYVLNAITRALRDWVMTTLGQSIAFYMAGNVIRHMIRLPLTFFETRHVGDLMSRVGSIGPIQNLLTHGLVSALIDTVLVVTTLIVMLLISPTLTALVVVFTIIYLAVTNAFYPGQRARSEEEIQARAVEQSYLMESIRAMRAVKLHGHEAQRESGWRNRYAEVISASYHARMYDIRSDFAENLLFGFSFLICVYVGAGATLDGKMTIGMLLAFLAYRSSFTSSASALVQQWLRYRLIGLHLERLADIVTEPREVVESSRLDRGARDPAALRLSNVSFSYGPGDPPVVSGVNLLVPAGTFLAIVGPSGAGKTTLMRLMLGLLTPSAGEVAVDGQPLTPAMMSAWRARVGAVLQDDCLLTGTIADNISFFDPRPDHQKIEQAARMARIDADITRMPMSYESLIGDMGAALSSGQRQRILLARALYREPDILFLDEGTANLDGDTESAIADMVAALPITRIIVAHRPALVERADMVVEVAETGLRPCPVQWNARTPVRLNR